MVWGISGWYGIVSTVLCTSTTVHGGSVPGDPNRIPRGGIVTSVITEPTPIMPSSAMLDAMKYTRVNVKTLNVSFSLKILFLIPR